MPMARVSVFALLLACVALAAARATVPVTQGMRTIGTAIKNGHIVANNETTFFEFAGGPGVITEQWYAGSDAMNEDMRIRIYIDGETTPSLDFNLFFAHSIGTLSKDESANLPWYNPRFAHIAGNVYNTIRIPFGKSIKITGTRPTTATFWYIVRGVENYPLIMGDLELPSNSRLRLYKTENVQLQPLDFITIADVSPSASGALYYLTVRGVSPDENYMEACFRAYIDGDQQPQFLSSGTEDMFLSSYYFETGVFHDANAGCTSKIMNYEPGPLPGISATPEPSAATLDLMTAYKLFENDPVLFTKGLKLVWRNWETTNGSSTSCASEWPPNAANNIEEIERQQELRLNRAPLPPSNTAWANYTVYVWTYEW